MESAAAIGGLIARYGGEEFGILLPKCNLENAYRIVERLRCGVPDQQTFSAGIALWDGEEKPEEAVARADAALYLAKQNGRNRSEFAKHPTVEGDLQEAVVAAESPVADPGLAA